MDIAKLIDEVSTKVRQEVSAGYEQKLSAVSSEVQTVKSQNREMALERYKAKKVAEAGGEDNLILSLVSGGSEQEIDAAVELAKQEFDKVKSKFASPASTPNPGNATGTPPTATPPVLPRTGTPPAAAVPAAGVPNVRNMPLDEYKKQRDAIKRQAAQRYAESAST